MDRYHPRASPTLCRGFHSICRTIDLARGVKRPGLRFGAIHVASCSVIAAAYRLKQINEVAGKRVKGRLPINLNYQLDDAYVHAVRRVDLPTP